MKNSLVISLPDGRQAALLVPDLNEGQSLSVVSTDVLEKLIKLLGRSKFEDQKFLFCENLSRAKNINEYTVLLTEELNFHRSVNIIESFLLSNITEEAMR
jgi:hypothetical protein